MVSWTGGTRPATAFGVVGFDVAIDVDVSGEALCSLAIDVARMVTVEPRLSSARWLDIDGPRPGARAEIVGDIPFTVPLVRRVIGRPTGVATLETIDPPHGLSYRLETPRATGRLEAAFVPTDFGCVAEVRGWIAPRSAIGRIALGPLHGLLPRLADDAVRRGILRAAEALHA